MSVLAHLPALERALTAQGFPALSPFWTATLERFYASGKRTLVARVGRRGGKSTSVIRAAVLDALYGGHQVPPGDIGVVPIISENKTQAVDRIRTVKAILDALNVPYVDKAESVELKGRPVVFRAYVASIGAVSGFTAIGAIADEVAKWSDSETGANPATEVLASLRPTMATQPKAKLWLISSPLGFEDAHAKAFDLGETDAQCIAFAPTWVANPCISEADARALEPDERVFRREYAAIPQAGTSQAFDNEVIEAAFRPWEMPRPQTYPRTPFMVIDASSGRGDAWAYGIARWVERDDAWFRAHHRDMQSYIPQDATDDGQRQLERLFPWQPHLQFTVVDAFEGKFWFESASGLISKLSLLAAKHGVRDVFGDQRDDFHIRDGFREVGLSFRSIPWTNQRKQDAVDLTRRLMAERRLILPESAAMKSELLSFQEKLTPTGSITYGARGSRHDDHVALLLTAAMATLEGNVSGGPRRSGGFAPFLGQFPITY